MQDSMQLRSLAQHLEKYVFAPTNRALGAGGSEYEIVPGEQRSKILVRLGFPVARSGPALAQGLEQHAAAGGHDVTAEWSWRVESHAVQHGLQPLPAVKNIVAVASGKGGVGKSTVAVNLALAAAQEGARVGLLDADIYGPSQPTMLGLVGKRPESRDGKSMEPLTAHGIDVISIGFLVDEKQPMAWRGPMVTSALIQLLTQTNWRDLDYLFVDMPPGTGDIQLTLAQRVPVSAAIIVTTPQNVALADARKALEMFQKVNVPVLGIVENMSMHICSNCGHAEPVFGSAGGDTLGAEYALPLLGRLPLESGIRQAVDEGVPTVVAEPDGAAAELFRALALRVMGELAATGKDYSHLFPKITIEERE
jgi:ATP-binding protein involved in chromosome partitioning